VNDSYFSPLSPPKGEIDYVLFYVYFVQKVQFVQEVQNVTAEWDETFGTYLVSRI
jgi:hypothetical protein